MTQVTVIFILKYKIRPNLLNSSFEVHCSFHEMKAYTEISVKDQPNDGFIFPSNESQRCNDPECFTQMINYLPTFKQIEVLCRELPVELKI